MANDNKLLNINTTEIHRENFPSADMLKKKIYERNFNKALSIIYPRLEQINLTNPYVRIMKSDFHIPSQQPISVPCAHLASQDPQGKAGAGQISVPCAHLASQDPQGKAGAYQIPEVVLTDVMNFLLEKGYRMANIEDPLCNHIGWRISF